MAFPFASLIPLLGWPPSAWQVELGESQWVNCDIRSFRMEILGQFGVIMADPPWDIHMELPYGTMADEEMKALNVPVRGGGGTMTNEMGDSCKRTNGKVSSMCCPLLPCFHRFCRLMGSSFYG